TFVSKVAGASIQWWLGRDKANHMLFAVRNAAGQLRVAYAAGATNDLSWHHVAGVYDGTKISLYVDGVSVAVPAALSGPIVGSHGAVCLGSMWNTASVACSVGPFLNGGLDEVRIYLRALSQFEIQTTMNVELAGSANGLAAYFK